MTTLKEKIAIMQAAEDGEWIEYKRILGDTNGCWTPATGPNWDWNSFDFRIKPQPKEIWVNEYPPEICYVHFNKEAAEYNCKGSGTTTHYREVL